MKKLLLRYILCLLFYFAFQSASGQCITGAESLGHLATIQEDNTRSFAEKIIQLQKLQNQYLKCNKKDSVYARLSHRIGDFFSKTGDFEKGLQHTKEAVSINLHAGMAAEKAFLSNSYFNLGT
ncbi:MAG: hypothetical protein ACXWV9_11675, partial [Flavisolibacter sp.]